MGDTSGNYDDVDFFNGWMTTWSDSFLRSYVKQKMNNVWMRTITLSDPDRNPTSPFHTYCVAVGRENLDHTPVIEWYANEINELMKGNKYYCVVRQKFITAKVGVVATLAERPEKAFLSKISLLGVFGKITSWAADIRPDVLADCHKCFDVRINALISDSEAEFPGPTCKSCCQWDLNSSSNSITSIHPPECYPKKCCPNSPPPPVGRDVCVRFIEPIKQTFD